MEGEKFSVQEIQNKIFDEGTGALKVTSTGSTATGEYFEDESGTALTSSFAQQSFGFDSRGIIIVNDSASRYIEWSWDGVNVHGKLKLGESITMDNKSESSIYLRGESGGEEYRVIAW